MFDGSFSLEQGLGMLYLLISWEGKISKHSRYLLPKAEIIHKSNKMKKIQG